MTLAEALVELGMESTATAEQIRRAYLRLLKTRKPETDPDGFRRLREAYEIVTTRRGYWAPAPPPRNAPVDATEADAPQASVPIVANPEESGTVPAPEDDEEVTALLDVQRLIAEDSLGQAADRLAEIYDKAVGKPGAMVPDPRVPIDLILRLQENARTSTARSLDTSFRRWLDATDSEVRILAGPLAARWALVKELGKLPERLSAPVRAIMARTARQGQLAVALSHLAHIRERSPEAARLDAGLLRQSDGPLARRLADELAPSPRYETTRRRSFGLWWMVGVGMMVLRGLTSLLSPTHDASPAVDKAALFAGRLDRLRAVAVTLRFAAADAGDTHLAEGARRLGDDLSNGDCGRALTHAADLIPQSADPPELEPQCRSLYGEVLAACSLTGASSP